MNTIRIATLALALGSPLAAMADTTPPVTQTNANMAPAAANAAAKAAPGTKAVGGKAAAGQIEANGDDRSTTLGTVVVPPRPPKKEALEAAKAGALKAKAAQP